MDPSSKAPRVISAHSRLLGSRPKMSAMIWSADRSSVIGRAPVVLRSRTLKTGGAVSGERRGTDGAVLTEVIDPEPSGGIVSNLFRHGNVVERGREGPSPSASPPCHRFGRKDRGSTFGPAFIVAGRRRDKDGDEGDLDEIDEVPLG